MKLFYSTVLACTALIFILFICPSCASAANRAVRAISIDAGQVFLDNSITGMAIKDACALLKKGFPNASVSINDPGADIHIVIAGRGGSTGEGYEWQSFSRKGRIVLVLNSPSFRGVGSGLYGLLQEKLGFKFYHPRRTILPLHHRWPLPGDFRWTASPRFARRGFHIHSLHPIELTEQLNNPDYPHAVADIKEYIDWLARNGQNTFQFYLLRDIDRTRWIGHAASVAAYAHKRGIEVGVEFSLFKIQQKAFQCIRLLGFSSYTHQVDNTLAWIFRANWDFVTVDFSMGEYMPDLGEMMPGLKEYLIRQVTQKYKTRIMVPTHVIDSQRALLAGHAGDSEPAAGVLIHTVMFYAIDEASAPVYGNTNLQSMLAMAVQENKRRETWYWPESAYWVCFDNSVPLLLLPYLDARWTDMNTMEKIGVDNHLTFSSGWEWGYWLVDWSIARWSWTYIDENNSGRKTSPLGILHDLFPDPGMYTLFQRALALQNYYLKSRNLIGFMSALDPSAELPWPFNSPFQPRPAFTASWLLFDAGDLEAQRIAGPVVAGLDSYAREMDAVVKGLETGTARIYTPSEQGSSEIVLIARELTRALEVTALRAQHRSLTIRALLAQRDRHWWQPAGPEAGRLLREAAGVRSEALALVRQQEAIYRYPVNLIARRRKDFTAYHFGYLYPASSLFFWRREEEQVRHRRFDAFYMNLWNFLRISGVGSLCP